MKKNLVFAVTSVILGILFSNYVINEYKTFKKVTAKEQKKILYFYQYAAFKNEKNMKNTLKNVKYYFYYKENDLYYVIVGISSFSNLTDKIKDSNNLDNLYVKKVIIKDNQIIKKINKYDTLVNNINDKNEILELEGKILLEYNNYYEKSFNK